LFDDDWLVVRLHLSIGLTPKPHPPPIKPPPPLIPSPDGTTTPRAGNIGPPVDPAATTRVVEFNDLPALAAALSEGDVAAVLMEPVMTNIGIIHPGESSVIEALRHQ